MLWTWISVTLFVMFVTWVAAAARFRSSMIKAADDLRILGRDFRQQAQQLTSTRQAERESKRESAKRGKELATLRARVQSLTTSLHTVTAERDSLKSQNENAEARIQRITEELAASQANKERLRIELEDASEIRWKLMSRIHTDAAQRALEFDQLQRPYISLPKADLPGDTRSSLRTAPAIEGPSSDFAGANDADNSAKAGPSNFQSSESMKPVVREHRGESDIVADLERELNHSVSFENLLQLKPDLSIPKYDDSFDEESPFEAIDADIGDKRPVYLSNSAKVDAGDIEKEPLALDRVPWADTVNPDLATEPSAGSIAAALHPAIVRKSSGWIVNGIRHGNGAIEKKDGPSCSSERSTRATS